MSEQKCIVLNWNVRGLNNRARRQVVKDMANDNACTIAALQETKLAVVNSVDVTEFLGARFSNQFAYLPANNTRGGCYWQWMKITILLLSLCVINIQLLCTYRQSNVCLTGG